MLLGPEGAQLAKLFDCLEEVRAWIKDRRGRYVWVNRSFLKNHVINEESPLAEVEQVRGRTDYDLCPPNLADQYHSDDAQVLAGNPVVNRIELVGRPDGLASWHLTNKIPLRSRNGRVVGSAGLTWELKERDAILVPAAGLSPVLSYIRDHYNKPISNTQFARLAGLSVRAFEGKFRSLFQGAAVIKSA